MRAADRKAIAEEVVANVLEHLRAEPKTAPGADLAYPTTGLQAHELRAASGGYEARETLLASAVEARKFPRERLDYYRSLYDADPATARELIDALTPYPSGLSNGRGAPVADDSIGDDSYPSDWLRPAERRAADSILHIERD